MATPPIRISPNYKDHPAGIYRFKSVRCGKSFYGEIREYKAMVAGRQLRVYWAAKLKGEYVKMELSWAYDKALISKFAMEGHGITHIGVLVTTDSSRRISNKGLIQEYWLTSMVTFNKHRQSWNYEGRVGKAPGAKGKEGSDQWILAMFHYKSLFVPIPHALLKKSVMI